MKATLSASVGILVILVAAGAAHAQSPQLPTGAWANKTGNYNFSYGGSASDGSYLYCFGGYQYGVSQSYPQYYQACTRYDPANDSWITRAYMPNPQYYNAGAYYNGVVYSFGGYNPNYGYWNGIQAYDVANDSWTTLSATLTSPRYIMPAVTLNNRIYIMGGYYNGYSAVNDEFDPSNNSVTARASLLNNQGLYYHAAAAVPALGKLYIFAGLLQGQQSSLCHEFTPPNASAANGSWAAKTNMSNGASAQTRYGHVAFTLNNRPYVTGGYNGGYTNTTFEYNPFQDSWTQRANMNNTRYLHAGAVVNGKGYVYGGYPTYTSCEEFTPPDFGLPPNAAANVAQAGSRNETALQSKADPNLFDGWTNNQVTFSANVTDPNAGQQVRFRVQVKAQGASWSTPSAVTSLATPLGAQGVHTLSYNIPADGGYDWRWRVEDSYANSNPEAPDAWVEAFGSEASPNTTSPDFRSDQVPPSDPIADAPNNIDIQAPDPYFGDVVLSWVESTDNGPVAGISYEIQVAREGGFGDIEAQLFSTAGVFSYPITLSVSRYNKYWRMRARDIGGNLSHWSNSQFFRVVNDDHLDHGAGDAKKGCGMMVGSGATSLIVGLLGLALIAQGGRRKLRM